MSKAIGKDFKGLFGSLRVISGPFRKILERHLTTHGKSGHKSRSYCRDLD
jgi:hypothetical protein